MYDSKNLEYHNPPVTSIKFDTSRTGADGMCEAVWKYWEKIHGKR